MDDTERALNTLCRAVLNTLDGDYCLAIRPIVNGCGLPEEVCRGLLRDMRERGFVEYHRGLMNESGDVAGAGYRSTLAGMDFARQTHAGLPGVRDE